MKKILSIVLVICLVFTTFGCVKIGGGKSKKAAAEEVTYTADDMAALEKELNEVKVALGEYDSKFYNSNYFKKRFELESGVLAFNKINNKIILEGRPISQSDARIAPVGYEATISLGDVVKVDADGWKVKTNTNEIYFYRDNKAVGTIEIYKYDDIEYDPDDYTAIKDFFEANDIEINKKTSIYANQSKVGMELTGIVSIYDNTEDGEKFSVLASQLMDSDELSNWGLDEDAEIEVTTNLTQDDAKIYEAKLRVGLANVNGILVEYEFLSKGADGNGFVNDLIANIQVNGKPLYLK